MTNLLIPRIDATVARDRLSEIEIRLEEGVPAKRLVQFNPPDVTHNPTGGQIANPEQLEDWRREVLTTFREGFSTRRNHGFENNFHGIKFARTLNSFHGIEFGRALTKVIDPLSSDGAHDGVWSFLSLFIFPDLVLERWSGTSDSLSGRISLPPSRWIGAQVARDRNYVKLCWRRWKLLGSIMVSAYPPLGEDEFGALLERSAVARNHRLIVTAARRVVSHVGPSLGRTAFTRTFMKKVCYQTGARCLDILTDEELEALLDEIASEVCASADGDDRSAAEPVCPVEPRRALEDLLTTTNE